MSDCLTSRVLDYIERLRRTDPVAWFWIETGELVDEKTAAAAAKDGLPSKLPANNPRKSQ